MYFSISTNRFPSSDHDKKCHDEKYDHDHDDGHHDHDDGHHDHDDGDDEDEDEDDDVMVLSTRFSMLETLL